MTGSGQDNARTYRIRGMCCAEEVGLLKGELGPLVGGAENLSFDLLNGKLTVIFNSLRLLGTSPRERLPPQGD